MNQAEYAPSQTMTAPSINALTAPLVAQLVEAAPQLGLNVETDESGCTLVDAGIDSRGGIEAGRRVAEICLGGLGEVRLTTGGHSPRWPVTLHVHSCNPVLACLGSQYAGWSLSHGEGKAGFHALGSGPGRALARKETLFEELGYVDAALSTCLVLEVDQRPPSPLIDKIIDACGVTADQLTLILTPTTSLAGSVQVVARVLEVALHKTHELGFDLDRVIDGSGSAPLCPPGANFLQAMGRTNDAILFGGVVQLYVGGDDSDAEQLARQLPSSASKDYGRPFAEVFKAYDYDFFKIDPHLFSPAAVIVTALDSGRSFHAGAIDDTLLDRSFGAAR